MVTFSTKRDILELLKKFKMENCIPIRTPKPVENVVLREKKFDETTYRRAIGSLLYLEVCTRPDIMFTVNRATKKNGCPTLEDWDNVLRIFRYLRGTIKCGLKFSRERTLRVYVDADYAGDLDTRRSTSGFLFIIGNSPISWYSRLQHCIATSTAEAEYYSLSECGKHTLWFINFLNELGINISCITII